MPKAIYGYFPVCSQKDSLLVYDPNTTPTTPINKRNIIAKFDFPRQKSGRILCIADFFKNVESGDIDTLGVQIVTLGEEFSSQARQLYESNNFTDYFYYHGLGTELTEAGAEWLHKKMRTGWGIANKDAKTLRQLFSQGYQGSRYSFGYPACPNMEGNTLLLNLLEANRIGVHISESFQMHPELTTSALVTWHPQARYFTT